MLHSARTADAIGRPLNKFVTINLWQLGIDHESASAAFQKLRERPFASWSRYRPRGKGTPRNGPPTYAWVIEAPEGRAHVHWMLHVQDDQEHDFATKLGRWILRLGGVKELPFGALRVENVHNADGLKLYFSKGLQPQLADRWGIRHVDQGLVHGRRAGTSRNIGPAEWKPRTAAYKRSRRVRERLAAHNSGSGIQPIHLAGEVSADGFCLGVR